MKIVVETFIEHRAARSSEECHSWRDSDFENILLALFPEDICKILLEKCENSVPRLRH